VLYLAAIAALSGCATYREGAFPSGPDRSEVAGEQVAVATGVRARVTLISGESFTGTVASVTETELELATSGGSGAPTRSIARADVKSIAIAHRNFSGTAIGAAILVGAVAVCIIAAQVSGLGGLN